MRGSLGLAAAAALVVAGLAGADDASSAELAFLHKQRVEGGRLCFATHFHYKESVGWPSKAHAVASVTGSWERFTSAEYGVPWGRLANAADVKLECAAGMGNRGPSWSCRLKARPCKG